MWPSLVRMWKEEGFRGFMKGNGINVVRVCRSLHLLVYRLDVVSSWSRMLSGTRPSGV